MRLSVKWTPADKKHWWRTSIETPFIPPFLPPLFITYGTFPPGDARRDETKDLFFTYPGFTLGSRKLPEIDPMRIEYREPLFFTYGSIPTPPDYNEIRDIYEPSSIVTLGPGTVAAIAWSICMYNLHWSPNEETTLIKFPIELFQEIINGNPNKKS